MEDIDELVRTRITVSYTHLDVYKRQPPPYIPARPLENQIIWFYPSLALSGRSIILKSYDAPVFYCTLYYLCLLYTSIMKVSH